MLNQLIKPELLVLLPVLYIIAELIKSSKIKNHWIPFILLGLSVLLTTLYLFSTTIGIPFQTNLLVGTMQGLFIGLTTVGSNQLFKQFADAKNQISDLKKPTIEKKDEAIVENADESLPTEETNTSNNDIIIEKSKITDTIENSDNL